MITSISIRNFRSIVSIKEKVLDLNIFVGQNDFGKSNILRALDLFFNHDKPAGYDFVWNRDYCSFASKRANKADEITIELEIKPPDSFSNKTPVLWTKKWRGEGFHSEEQKHSDGSRLSPKSKVASFLKAMRYDYVPAIKGNDYFQSLMAKLHDMLEATVEEQVRNASGTFTSTINDNTKSILGEIKERLGLETTIQLPSNLRALFAQLEFTSVSGDKPFSLNQRGDGIKVRHIPIVLRWLAEQANHLSAPGRPKCVTVWGYEEPENNLELRRCFELAKELVSGGPEIQTFVTTHSPAFYSVFRDSDPSKVSLFLVSKEDQNPISNVRPLNNCDLITLDSSMGLLDLLEPHFKEARLELESLRNTVDAFSNSTKPILLVEGKTDALILQSAWEKLFPNSRMRFEIIPCGIEPKPEIRSGGAETLRRCIEFLAIASERQIIGLFDNDRSGNEQFSGLNKAAFEQASHPGHKKHLAKPVHSLLLPVPPGREAFVTIDDIVQRYLSIEHYFSDSVLIDNNMKGPSILGTEVYVITGDKMEFARHASVFGPDEFSSFHNLFNEIASIINSSKDLR